MSVAPTFYRLPGSHYSERAEMLLQLKGVPYERRTLRYVETRTVLPKEVGDDTVPALKLDDGTVVHWRAIPGFLESRHPEPPIYPRDAAAREEVERWEEWLDLVVGHAVRRLGYWEMRENPDLRRRFFRVKDPVGEVRSLALLRFLMSRYGATAWTREHDLHALLAFLRRAERGLDRNGGAFLVVPAVTAADVAAAALLHPLQGTATSRALGHERVWEWARAMRERLKPKRREAAPRAP